MREVQAAAVKRRTWRPSAAARQPRRQHPRAVSYTSALAPSLEALGYVAIGVVAVTGKKGQDIFGTAVSLGLIVTFLGYVQRFNQPIQQTSILWANVQSAVAGAERIFGLLDEVPGAGSAGRPAPCPASRAWWKFEKRVTAAYKVGELVLREVSFRPARADG